MPVARGCCLPCQFLCLFKVVFVTPKAIFRRSFFVRPIFAFPAVWGGIVLFFAPLRQYSFHVVVDCDQYARGSGVLFALPVFLSG